MFRCVSFSSEYVWKILYLARRKWIPLGLVIYKVPNHLVKWEQGFRWRIRDPLKLGKCCPVKVVLRHPNWFKVKEKLWRGYKEYEAGTLHLWWIVAMCYFNYPLFLVKNRWVIYPWSLHYCHWSLSHFLLIGKDGDHQNDTSYFTNVLFRGRS